MANHLEIHQMQMNLLYDFLKLKAINENSGNHVEGLDDMIARAMGPMSKEDIDSTEKRVYSVFGKK
ncbi:MAG: hypothetical protein LBE35_09060 [Clostridiales bacterium]|jgi:hypothetical protein|nr:hypothetical protein [Clostridiales bacterium]